MVWLVVIAKGILIKSDWHYHIWRENLSLLKQILHVVFKIYIYFKNYNTTQDDDKLKVFVVYSK